MSHSNCSLVLGARLPFRPSMSSCKCHLICMQHKITFSFSRAQLLSFNDCRIQKTSIDWPFDSFLLTILLLFAELQKQSCCRPLATRSKNAWPAFGNKYFASMRYAQEYFQLLCMPFYLLLLLVGHIYNQASLLALALAYDSLALMAAVDGFILD